MDMGQGMATNDTFSNHVSSAMVSVPLNELDKLRADLMRTNTELVKMKDSQGQIIVTHKTKYVREYPTGGYDSFGNSRWDKDLKWFENVVPANISEVTSSLEKAYNDRRDEVLAESRAYYDKELIDEKARMEEKIQLAEARTRQYEASLRDKFNADRLEELEYEIAELKQESKRKSEAINTQTAEIKTLDAIVRELKPKAYKLERLAAAYLAEKELHLNLIQRFVKGFYVKVDKLLNDVIDE